MTSHGNLINIISVPLIIYDLIPSHEVFNLV